MAPHLKPRRSDGDLTRSRRDWHATDFPLQRVQSIGAPDIEGQVSMCASTHSGEN
jgi:hypothetical protein